MKCSLATLLYGSDPHFLLGARLLGQSVIATTENIFFDMVVLFPSGTVRIREREESLRRDGWDKIVIVADYWDKPRDAHLSSPRLRQAYAKLGIFELPYDRVVYVDADVVAARSLEALFECRGFCASMRHSELFNTGVMTVEPSATLASNLRASLDLYSYTGGDQGLLNSYFPDFVECPEFRRGVDDHASCHRLPASFNVDWPLVFLRGTSSRYFHEDVLVHYTLGGVKAWTWYIAPFLPTPHFPQTRFFFPKSIFLVVATTFAARSLVQRCGGDRRNVPSKRLLFALFLLLSTLCIVKTIPSVATAPFAWTYLVFSLVLQVCLPYSSLYSPSTFPFRPALFCLALVIAILLLPTCLLEPRTSWTLVTLLAVELPLVYVGLAALPFLASL